MKAFPISVMTYEPNHPDSPRYTTSWHEGMDLRDYFAAKAMEAWINQLGKPNWDETIAQRAYKMADAMMKARKQHD
jgi:hypothetical protein